MVSTSSRIHASLLAATLVLTACGGSDDDAGTATTAAATSPPTSSPTTTEPAATVPPATTAPATAPSTAPATTAPPPTTVPAPEPWTPAGPGPYEVGVTTVVIDDAERPLTVEVWFPLDTAVDVPPQRYTLVPGVYYESPDAFAAPVGSIADAEPFPLIVYSHGSGAIRFLHSSYTEALASHGHVVVAADHTGNTVFDRLAGTGPSEQTAVDRPTDVSRLIDAFTNAEHPTAGPFARAVDAERVAVTGHSLGGFTSIASVTGIDTPNGAVPPDERVDAIMPLAPAVLESLLSDERLATLDVPMMIVVGTDDATTPVDPNVTRLWELTTNSPAYRVELVAGEHQTFTDFCAYQDFLPQLEAVPEVVIDIVDDFSVEGCSPGDIDAARAAELTNTYVLRFLDEVFRGGPAIDPTVVATPDDVIFEAR